VRPAAEIRVPKAPAGGVDRSSAGRGAITRVELRTGTPASASGETVLAARRDFHRLEDLVGFAERGFGLLQGNVTVAGGECSPDEPRIVGRERGCSASCGVSRWNAGIQPSGRTWERGPHLL